MKFSLSPVQAARRSPQLVAAALFAAALLFAFVALSPSTAAADEGGSLSTAAGCTLSLITPAQSALVGSRQTVTAVLSTLHNEQLKSQDINDELDGSTVVDACYYGQISELAGLTVHFKVVGGPNFGVAGTATLDNFGHASFGYVGLAAGTDTVVASLQLPDVCLYYGEYDQSESVEGEGEGDGEGPSGPCDQPEIGPASTAGVTTASYDGPMVTLSAAGPVVWTAPVLPTPAPVVSQSAISPSLSIARLTRCVSHRFSIRPAYHDGTVKLTTLFIDGRRVGSHHGSTKAFRINAGHYKAGRHHIELVSTFANGKTASKISSFKRCAARAAVRKIKPKFTG